MRRGILLWTLGVLITCFSTAHAVQLAYKDTPGTVRWYRTRVVFYGSFIMQPTNRTIGINGTAGFTSVEKVLAVSTDGAASIQTKIFGASIFLNLPNTDRPPITVPISDFTVYYKRLPTGKLTDITIKGAPAPITGTPGMNFPDVWKLLGHADAGVEFPTGALQPGDTWTKDASIEILGQRIDSQHVNTLKGPRIVDQVSYQQIDSKITMKAPALVFHIPNRTGQTLTIHETEEATMKSSALFNAAAGELFTSWLDGDSNFSLTLPKPSTGQSITITGTLHLSGGMSKIAAPHNATPPVHAVK